MQTESKLMKKVLAILLLCLTACSVSSFNNTDTIVTPSTNQSEETKDLDTTLIWEIEPTIEYDNAIINFRFDSSEVIFVNGFEPYNNYHRGDVLVEKNNKYGLLDENGNVLVNSDYTNTHMWYNNRIRFTSEFGGAPCAHVNADDSVEYFSEGCGIGSDGYYLAFINTSNGFKLLAYEQHDETESIKNRYGDKFLITSRSLENIGINDYILINRDEVIEFGLNPNEFHCFDYSSNIVLFSSYWNYDNTFYAINPKYYDEKGNLLFEGFDAGLGFYGGYAPVMKNDKWGFIDTKGNLVIDYIFDSATQIYESKSWVVINGKLGKLNIIELINSNYQFSQLLSDVH